MAHSNIIMDTHCGYLRTAIGRPTTATVADVCSYFAQAAQSGSDEGPSGGYEAPLNAAQLQKHSIGNVLRNERVHVTVQSFYFMPANGQEQLAAREINRQVIENASVGDRDEMELAQALALRSTDDDNGRKRNARVKKTIARQRARAKDVADRTALAFGIPPS